MNVTAKKLETWIRPANGERLKVLQDLSKEAAELMEICELEISGVRDGDGFWSGGDVLFSSTRSIQDHYEHLRQVEKASRESA